jgi:DNA-binding MurR/RpiR family transcriptional regulator
MDNILFYIRHIIPTLTTAEKKIAKYVVNNPDKVPMMKIANLGEASETNAPAVTRFCKKIGLPGYPELKLEVAKCLFQSGHKELDMTTLNFTNDIDLQQAPEVSTVIKNIITTATNSFTLLEKLLNQELIKKTVDAIRKARKVLIVGIGASGVVGLDLYQKLIRLGIDASYNAETHLQMVCASTLGKEDLAFVISYSGETPEIISIAKRAKAMGATVIGVTRIGNSSLYRLADSSLLIPNTESICRNGAFVSRLDQMLINDMLFYTFVTQYYKEYQDKINETWASVSSFSSKLTLPKEKT